MGDRRFFSAISECNSNCRYCFSKWNNYSRHSHFTCETINEDDLIIYPYCDGNIFDDCFNKLLAEFLKVKKRVFISISTKNIISEKQMNELVKINEFLKSHNNGFLKLSVSFSSLEKINDIEQGTLNYTERLSLIKNIIDHDLTYATILKPLLPFIPVKEYEKIVDDTFKFSNNYILGGLYVNPDIKIFEEYNLEKYEVVDKTVNWAHGNPTWKYMEDANMKKQICDHISNSGGKFYDSDAEFIKDFNT